MAETRKGLLGAVGMWTRERGKGRRKAVRRGQGLPVREPLLLRIRGWEE